MFTKDIQQFITLDHAKAYFKILESDRDKYLNLAIREIGYSPSGLRRIYMDNFYNGLIRMNAQEAE